MTGKARGKEEIIIITITIFIIIININIKIIMGLEWWMCRRICDNCRQLCEDPIAETIDGLHIIENSSIKCLSMF